MSQENQEGNSADTGNNVSTHQTYYSKNTLSGGGTPPNSLQPPRGKNHAPDEPEHWWQDRKYKLELCGFAVLVGYTIFSGLMWWHVRWTNKMMREGLDGNNSAIKQTLDRLDWQAKETHEIAKQTLTEATQTGNIATDTHNLALTAAKQSGAAQALAEAARDQAETSHTVAENSAKQVAAMQRQMESDQRAWLGFNNVEVKSASTVDPVSADNPNAGTHLGNETLHISEIVMSVTNTGKTPATVIGYEACFTPGFLDRDGQPRPKNENCFTPVKYDLRVFAPGQVDIRDWKPGVATTGTQMVPAIFIAMVNLTYWDVWKKQVRTTKLCIYAPWGEANRFVYCPNPEVNSME